MVAAAISGAISVSAERDLAGMRTDPTNFERRLQDAGFDALSRDVRLAAQDLRQRTAEWAPVERPAGADDLVTSL